MKPEGYAGDDTDAGTPRLSDHRRPGAASLRVGAEDSEGVLELLVRLLDASVERHLRGLVSQIEVHVGADHFSVRDDGPGPSRRELGPALSRLPSASLDAAARSSQRRGRSLAIINSLAAQLEIVGSRHGARRRWLFESFSPTIEGHRLGPSSASETLIRVWPDPSLFASTTPDLSMLEARLAALHAARPSLELALDGRPLTGPRGPRAWVEREVAGAVEVHHLEARRGNAHVELAYAWLPPFGAARRLSFVNLAETPADGSHIDALIDALARHHQVSPAMARERCLAMICVQCPSPRLRATWVLRLDDDALYRWIFELVGRSAGGA